MNDKTFENYQNRMLDAIKNSNEQSNDPFTKLSNILENLKLFVNTGMNLSKKSKNSLNLLILLMKQQGTSKRL